MVDYEIDIEGLQDQTRALANERDLLRTRQDEIAAERDAARGDFWSRALEFERVLKALASDKEALSQALATTQGERDALAAERVRLVTDLDRRVGEIGNFSTQFAELERALIEANNEKDVLSQTLSSSRAERETLAYDSERLAADLDARQGELNDLSARAAEFERTLRDATNDNEALSQALASSRAERDALADERARLVGDLDSRLREIGDLSARFAELERLSVETANDKEALSQQLASSRAERNALADERERLAADLDARQRELGNLSARVTEFEEALSEVASDKEALSQALASSRAGRDALTNERARLAADLDARERQLAESSVREAELGEALGKALSDREMLVQAAASKEGEPADALHHSSEVEREREAISANLERMKGEKSKAEAQLSDFATELSRARRDKNELATRLDRLAAELQGQRQLAVEQVAAANASRAIALRKEQIDNDKRIQALRDQLVDAEAALSQAKRKQASAGLFPALSRAMTARKLVRSGLLDPDWYEATYPDVHETGLGPAVHYLEIGFARGYKPNPFFDTRFYLEQNEDVRRSGLNPLLHYLLHGWREGRDPAPNFETTSYLDANPDVRERRVNPLAHYLNNGRHEGLLAQAEIEQERSSFSRGLSEVREEFENAKRHLLNEREQLLQVDSERKRQIVELESQVAKNAAEKEAIKAESHTEFEKLSGEAALLSAGAREADAERLDATLELTTRQTEINRAHGVAQLVVDITENRLRRANSTMGCARALFQEDFRNARRMEREIRLVSEFLDSFSWTLVGVPPEGRRGRVIRYLLGLTDFLPDFPFLRNLEYLDMHPDVVSASVPPLVHYLAHGQAEGRNVHPLMDTSYYLQLHPEAQHAASCPALHYLQWGMQKGFDPHPLFKTTDYRRRYQDVGESGRNPLLHWLEFNRCTVHPLFDAAYYLQTNPDVAKAGRNALTYYLLHGWKEGRNPHPLFDTNYYLDAHPDVRQAGVNPLVHYVQHGWRESRRSSSHFDPQFYLAAYPDIAAGGIDPLTHYVQNGATDGRHPVRPATAAAVAPGEKRIALFIDALYPRPDQDSGLLDQIGFMRIFQQMGYEVHFASVLEFGVSFVGDSRPYLEQLKAIGVKCVTADEYDFLESYMFLNNDRIEVVFGSRVNFGGTQLAAARRLCPKARTIFNTVDLHFVREEREATLANDQAKREQADATRAKELGLAAEADATIVVSKTEKLLLADLVPSANVIFVPLIREFSNSAIPPFEERQGIAFIGGFLHKPNVDALENFLSWIWPSVHARRPDIRFSVIGSNMPEEMKARHDPGVDFLGFVAELEPKLAEVRLTVAPLRYGAGAKGKLVSSLGQGVPSVISPVAAEGMGLVDRRDVLIEDLTEVFADRIVELYDDKVLWTTLSNNGLDFVRKNYSLAVGRSILEEAIATLEVGNYEAPAI